MKTITIIAATLILAAPGALSAATPSQEQPPPERKICRTQKMTGSLTRRTRICLTERQWRELNSRTKQGVDQMVSGASGGRECVQDMSGGCR